MSRLLPRFTDEPTARKKRSRSCHYCGEKNLYWRETEDGWRLVIADGSLHRCTVLADLAAAAAERDDNVRKERPNKGGKYGLRCLTTGRWETKDGAVLIRRTSRGWRSNRHTYGPVWKAIVRSTGEEFVADTLEDALHRANVHHAA